MLFNYVIFAPIEVIIHQRGIEIGKLLSVFIHNNVEFFRYITSRIHFFAQIRHYYKLYFVEI